MADPQGNDGFITELDIRIWLRDNNPADNLLLDDYEFTPEELRTAQTLSVDYWNENGPQVHYYNIETFPYRNAFVRATAANLLFIAAHRYRRNDLSYNIPGGAVNDQDKWKSYDAAGQKLWDEYKRWVTQEKRRINMSEGWATE